MKREEKERNEKKEVKKKRRGYIFVSFISFLQAYFQKEDEGAKFQESTRSFAFLQVCSPNINFEFTFSLEFIL